MAQNAAISPICRALAFFSQRDNPSPNYPSILAGGSRLMEPAKWADAQRLESWAGEIRVNLIRLIALVVFYGHHLVNVYWLQDNPEAAGTYHATITLLVLAWASAVVILH